MSILLTPAIQPSEIARRLVQARRDRLALATFPGDLPLTLAAAYQCQDLGIAQMSERIVGWKVGGIPAQWQAQFGETRLLGPIFSSNLRLAESAVETPFPIIQGGFAAVEAEIVFRLGQDPPALRAQMDAHSAIALVDAVFVGVETAGSPLAQINVLGPLAVVSDFGNNFGLIVGAQISGPLDSREQIPCLTLIDDVVVGRYVLTEGLNAPAQALAFALRRTAERQWPLRRGDFISTGALTGIHDIRESQQARICMGAHPAIVCRAYVGSRIEPQR